MERLEREAYIVALADELTLSGSWCGETHLQKAVYFLQELMRVPLDFEFILYKHGPFSFDLRDELTAMRANGLIELEVKPMPYGPSLGSTDIGEKIVSRFNDEINGDRAKIRYVADIFGDKGVAELERLATALFVYRAESKGGLDVGGCAAEIRELKPHVAEDAARAAAKAVKDMFPEVNGLN